MRKIYITAVVTLTLGTTGFFILRNGGGEAGPGQGAKGPGASARPPMTVELATVSRASLNERIVVVGNLIGAATVEVAPKIGGRLQSVAVRIGDRVSHGQMIAKVEDQEIREQVKQVQASHDVSSASVRQREADLKLAEISLERSRSLFARQLLSKQALDEVEAGHQAAVAQLDLVRAQFEQAKARLEELQINLANTVIASPVDGFVGKRNLDPGAYVSPNTPVASVVDIHLVRLVANLVEKDLRRVSVDMPTEVEVDAYPGETFEGRLARVAPVLDPATRTAEMEVEVPNGDFRLKPGMYARVRITVDHREAALVVPRNAVVALEGRRGVFVAQEAGTPGERREGAFDLPSGNGPASAALTAQFRPVETGLEEQEWVEIVTGIVEGERVVTTGAGALNGRRPHSARRPRTGAGPRTHLGGPVGEVRSRENRSSLLCCSLRIRSPYERSTYRNPSPYHDVHDLRRHYHSRSHLSHPSAGRLDAGRQLPQHHHPRQLPGRRTARDRGADHPTDRAGGERRGRPRANQLDLVRRAERRALELRLGYGSQRRHRRCS